MRTEIELTDGKKVTVRLPHFRKDDAHYYKVISKHLCLTILPVCQFGMKAEQLYGGIELHHAGLAWNSNSGTTCSEQEFKQAYKETVEKLNVIYTLTDHMLESIQTRDAVEAWSNELASKAPGQYTDEENCPERHDGGKDEIENTEE